MPQPSKFRAAYGTAGLQHYDIAALRAASEIVKVIDDYVRLRRVGAGSRYMDLCPFHREKNASFSVDQARKFFYCFGCGAAGDVFKFVMMAERVTFREALELLSKRYGVTPAGIWTPAQRRCYARRAAVADFHARRMSDWANGKLTQIESILASETDEALAAGADPTAVLAELHRAAQRLRTAPPTELARDYRQELANDSREVERLVGLGCDHRENAELMTRVVIDMLAQAQGLP